MERQIYKIYGDRKMKRCIFSLYVEIKNYEEDRWTEKNKFAKDQFSLYHNFLTVCQKKYADKVKADYILFTDDENYKKYKLSYDSYIFRGSAIKQI